MTEIITLTASEPSLASGWKVAALALLIGAVIAGADMVVHFAPALIAGNVK